MRSWVCALGMGLALVCAAEDTDYVAAAMKAVKAGRDEEALKVITEGITAQPKESRFLNVRSQIHQLMGNTGAAEKDLTAAIELEGTSGWLFQERGQLRFRLGRLNEAVADFDRANELAPKLEPQNWQRGIALFYAGRYTEGRKQFESHRTVNPDDVENAVWHFLCVARESNVEQARKALFPLGGDTRVPMKQIHALFAGRGTEKEVLAAADDARDNATIRTQRFYANLYLGLYHDILGQRAKAEDDLRLALILAESSNYMAAVARVHVDRLAEKPGKTERKP